jgi:hypothetical protein
MNNMSEINFKLKTINVGLFNIDNIISLFGDRIKKAIYVDENHNSGLISKEMLKICKKWKFWNKDIQLAYRHYYGYILIPYIFIQEKPEIFNKCGRIYNKYQKTKITDKLYCELNHPVK